MLRDFKSLFSWPAKEKPLLKTAAETINESAACKKAAALEEKESAINMYLKFVQDAEGKTAMQAELQKTLDGMIKERDIFSKKGQELVINVERMKEAQQKQVADWAERMGKWKVNGNAEAEKATKRKGALQEQIQIATKALADLQEAETENKQKWAEELVVQTKWHKEKLAEWQTRINSVVNVPSEAIPPTPSLQLDDAKEDSDYDLETEWIPSDAPKLVPPNEGESEWLSQLWARLQIWNRNSKASVLYRELAGPGECGVMAIKSLLGDKFWDSMYGQREVMEYDIVPLQLKFLLTFILGALTKDIIKHATHAEKVTAAEAAFLSYKIKNVHSRKKEKATSNTSVMKVAQARTLK